MEPTDVRDCRDALDIEWHLLSHLTAVRREDDSAPVTLNGLTWIQVMGYRRGPYVHAVFRQADTRQFAFHASEGGWLDDTPPNMGIHPSFSAMLSSVAQAYAVLWGLSSSSQAPSR